MLSALLLAEMLLRAQLDFFAVEREFFVSPPKPVTVFSVQFYCYQ